MLTQKTQGYLAGGVVLAAAIMAAHPAQAVITITATEDGSNVTFSFAGTLDVSGLVKEAAPQIYSAGLNAAVGALNFGNTPGFNNSVDSYSAATSGPVSFGPGVGSFITNTTNLFGDSFFVQGIFYRFGVPIGYQSGTQLAGGFSVAGTFASLGIDDSQSYVWTLNNTAADTITLQFQPTPVPEPLTLLGASAAIAFGAGFKRRSGKATEQK